MSLSIETRNLSRHFGDFVAVEQLSLAVNSAEIFGLLGPNAAGKSTTIRMLAGILSPTSGSAEVLGLDLSAQAEMIKRRIGYVAQQFSLYPDLTVYENLAFYAGLYDVHDVSRLQALLELYSLKPFRDRLAGVLSGGYKRRLAMACATTHDPELIFLDEPTAGIDPVTRKELWDLFYDLATSGKTLFVTTHYMEEAERCNRLAFLDHGRLVAQGTPLEIRRSLRGRQVYSCEIAHDPELSRVLAAMPEVQLVNQFGSELRIIVDASMSAERLEQVIARYHTEPVHLTAVAASIEDAFMSLTTHRSSERDDRGELA